MQPDKRQDWPHRELKKLPKLVGQVVAAPRQIKTVVMVLATVGRLPLTSISTALPSLDQGTLQGGMGLGNSMRCDAYCCRMLVRWRDALQFIPVCAIVLTTSMSGVSIYLSIYILHRAPRIVSTMYNL